MFFITASADFLSADASLPLRIRLTSGCTGSLLCLSGIGLEALGSDDLRSRLKETKPTPHPPNK